MEGTRDPPISRFLHVTVRRRKLRGFGSLRCSKKKHPHQPPKGLARLHQRPGMSSRALPVELVSLHSLESCTELVFGLVRDPGDLNGQVKLSTPSDPRRGTWTPSDLATARTAPVELSMRADWAQWRWGPRLHLRGQAGHNRIKPHINSFTKELGAESS